MFVSASSPLHSVRQLPRTSVAAAAATETAPVMLQDGFVASSAQPALSPQLVVPTSNNASPATATVDIKDVQAQLSEGLPGVGIDFLNTDSFDKLNGRLATMGELKEMMAALYDESNIPYGYITDGCYARAHLMDESLRQHGINNAKMFCRGDLEAKNDLMTARWWYHVAPLVFVDGGEGKPIPKIIDPGFSREPMDPEQWVKAMNKGPNVEIDLVSAEQYYPRDGRPDDNFSESLSPAVGTMQSYARRLHGIKKGKGLPVGEFVKPTWDKPGSGGDFVVDGKTLTVFPEGVDGSREPAYRVNSAVNGTLTMEPMPEREPVSASWDKRPAGFDPYKKNN